MSETTAAPSPTDEELLNAADGVARGEVLQLARNRACEALQSLNYASHPADLVGTVISVESLLSDARHDMAVAVQLLNLAGVADPPDPKPEGAS